MREDVQRHRCVYLRNPRMSVRMRLPESFEILKGGDSHYFLHCDHYDGVSWDSQRFLPPHSQQQTGLSSSRKGQLQQLSWTTRRWANKHSYRNERERERFSFLPKMKLRMGVMEDGSVTWRHWLTTMGRAAWPPSRPLLINKRVIHSPASTRARNFGESLRLTADMHQRLQLLMYHQKRKEKNRDFYLHWSILTNTPLICHVKLHRLVSSVSRRRLS